LVLVRLQGGLGNQLFEYSAGLAVAGELGVPLRCLPSNSPGIPIESVLPNGAITFADASDVRRFRMSNASDPLLVRAANRLQRKAPWYRRQHSMVLQGWSTMKFSAAERTFVASTPYCYLSGWFIHRSWFAPVLPEVSSLIHDRLREHPGYLAADGALVVSFRRGDYVRVGFELSLDYYADAMERLGGHTGPCWVVCDDEAFGVLAAEWLTRRGLNASAAPSFEGSRALGDLALLAGATNVVMSNSTFCWWGVVAGDRADRAGRRVIVPDPWIPARSEDLGLPAGIPLDGGLSQPGWERVNPGVPGSPH
jgi:hypothetical protein